MKKIILPLVLSFSSAASFAENRYFFAQDLKLEQPDEQPVLIKNVLIHFTRPCWAKYVDVVEKVIWEAPLQGKNPTRYRVGLAVLFEGDSKNSTCLGFSKERKEVNFNVYRMQESDFVEFVNMDVSPESSSENDDKKSPPNGAEPNGGKKD